MRLSPYTIPNNTEKLYEVKRKDTLFGNKCNASQLWVYDHRNSTYTSEQFVYHCGRTVRTSSNGGHDYEYITAWIERR